MDNFAEHSSKHGSHFHGRRKHATRSAGTDTETGNNGFEEVNTDHVTPAFISMNGMIDRLIRKSIQPRKPDTENSTHAPPKSRHDPERNLPSFFDSPEPLLDDIIDLDEKYRGKPGKNAKQTIEEQLRIRNKRIFRNLKSGRVPQKTS